MYTIQLSRDNEITVAEWNDFLSNEQEIILVVSDALDVIGRDGSEETIFGYTLKSNSSISIIFSFGAVQIEGDENSVQIAEKIEKYFNAKMRIYING